MMPAAHPRATRRPLLAPLALATLLAFAGASPLRAQAPLAPVKVTARAVKADQLDARAVVLEQVGKLRQAADLRMRAADLRGAGEADGVHSLRMASIDRYYGGQLPDAGRLMVLAADRAAAMGDVLAAAHSYIDAAYISAELKDAPRTRDLVDRGTLLMNSPLLDAGQRAGLRARVAQVDPVDGTAGRALAVLARP